MPVAPLLVLLTLPLLLAADDAGEYRANYRRIEGMTAVQRAELERKFETYRNLTDQQREQLHRLHSELRDDPELRAAMLEYYEWLQTLSPWQRDELRQLTDPVARAQRAASFKKQQADPSSRRLVSPTDSQRDRGSRRSSRSARFGPRLGPEEFAKVIDTVADYFVIRDDDRQRSESLSGLSRSLFVLSIPMELDEDEDDDRQRRPLAERLAWMSESFLSAMSQQVEDASIKDLLASGRPLEERRKDAGRLIIRGLFSQLHDELSKLDKDESKLRDFFEQLDSRRRSELVHREARDQQRRLKWWYLKEHNKEIDDYFWQTVKTLGSRPRGGPRSRGDRSQGFRNPRDRVQGVFQPQDRRRRNHPDSNSREGETSQSD